MADVNAFGQPVGRLLAGWNPRPFPPRTPMGGRLCSLEPLTPDHAGALYEADSEAHDESAWTYLSVGPFRTLGDYEKWCAAVSAKDDPQFFIIRNRQRRVVGRASFMRIDPGNGVIEIGNILFAPALQRTSAATEAIALLMRRAFDELGYRRLEWKCDALNAPSRAAALRLGFVFEGIFRQATIVKGRNRDTAWYAIIDDEWPALRRAYDAWLTPENFEADGRQRRRLTEIISEGRGR